MKEIKDFKEAWDFLNNHKIFWLEIGTSEDYYINMFDECLTIAVVKVNPQTKEIDNNENLNTQTEVWLECGPFDENDTIHDIDLDCGADTFEQAIIKLSNLVLKKYGK